MSAPTSRVWFITGTSSGLGKALLQEVLSTGDRVIATCRQPSVLSEFSQKYPKSQLLVQQLDLLKPEQVTAAFAAGIEAFGRVDVVVNNAGYAVFGEIEGISEEDARHEFEVQFWGPVRVMKEAARIFREVNPAGAGGRVFCISSIGGYRANPTLSYYSASKFALEAFTQSYLQEMATPSWNVKGCIIQPGGFDSEWRTGSANVTPVHPAYTDPSNPTAIFRSMHSKIPVLGSSVKMAQAIIRLADESIAGDLPLRVQFGSESLYFVRQQAENTIRDGKKWANVSHSTNLDGMDGEKYLKEVLFQTGSFDDVDNEKQT